MTMAIIIIIIIIIMILKMQMMMKRIAAIKITATIILNKKSTLSLSRNNDTNYRENIR